MIAHVVCDIPLAGKSADGHMAVHVAPKLTGAELPEEEIVAGQSPTQVAPIGATMRAVGLSDGS